MTSSAVAGHSIIHIIIIIFFYIIDGIIVSLLFSVFFPLCDQPGFLLGIVVRCLLVRITFTSSCGDFVFWYFVVDSRLVLLPINKIVCEIW
jgi:hypothetical protein